MKLYVFALFLLVSALTFAAAPCTTGMVVAQGPMYSLQHSTPFTCTTVNGFTVGNFQVVGATIPTNFDAQYTLLLGPATGHPSPNGGVIFDFVLTGLPQASTLQITFTLFEAPLWYTWGEGLGSTGSGTVCSIPTYSCVTVNEPSGFGSGKIYLLPYQTEANVSVTQYNNGEFGMVLSFI
jgi:hypothetical protein